MNPNEKITEKLINRLGALSMQILTLETSLEVISSQNTEFIERIRTLETELDHLRPPADLEDGGLDA